METKLERGCIYKVHKYYKGIFVTPHEYHVFVKTILILYSVLLLGIGVFLANATYVTFGGIVAAVLIGSLFAFIPLFITSLMITEHITGITHLPDNEFVVA